MCRSHGAGRFAPVIHVALTVLPTKIFPIEGKEPDSVLVVRVSSPQERLNLYSVNSKRFR